MKITIYELLGMIKDGKAPKKVRYRYSYLYKDFKFDGETLNYISDKDWLFGEDITAMLNDEVEILEEEKKIPERLNKNYYITQPDINQPSKVSYNMEQLLEMVQDIYEKQGEICDYLKSKGEK